MTLSTYTIKSGDTLYKVAQLYKRENGSSKSTWQLVNTIAEKNGIENINRVRAGINLDLDFSNLPRNAFSGKAKAAPLRTSKKVVPDTTKPHATSPQNIQVKKFEKNPFLQNSNLDFDHVADYLINTLEKQGFIKNDGGQGPSQYGVTWNNNKELLQEMGYCSKDDVRRLTKGDAKTVYYKNYWKKSKAHKIKNPKLAAVHFFSYVNRPATARKALRASGGDYKKYLAHMENWYQTNGKKSEVDGLINRVNRIERYVKEL